MSWRTRFNQYRSEMNPGDVIAFGGNSELSRLIREVSRSEVSHAAVISHGAESEGGPWLVESSMREGGAAPAAGVAKNPLEVVIDIYDGNVWWLPLRHPVPRGLPDFDLVRFQDSLVEIMGVPFDYQDGPRSVIRDLIERTVATPAVPIVEDLDTFFCSELVTYSLEKAGVLHEVNSSLYSPKDLCEWQIYRGDPVLLKGAGPGTITGFNSKKAPRCDRVVAGTVPDGVRLVAEALRSPRIRAAGVADKIVELAKARKH